MNQLTAKLRKGNKLGGFKERLDMPDDALTLDYIFDNVVIRGSVNRVVDGILALHERIGDFGTLLYCGKDWADPQLGRKSMELMAEKVMPAVNRAIMPMKSRVSMAVHNGRFRKNGTNRNESPEIGT